MEEAQDALEHEGGLIYIADELAARSGLVVREKQADGPARYQRRSRVPTRCRATAAQSTPGRHGQGLHQGLAVHERHADRKASRRISNAATFSSDGGPRDGAAEDGRGRTTRSARSHLKRRLAAKTGAPTPSRPAGTAGGRRLGSATPLAVAPQRRQDVIINIVPQLRSPRAQARDGGSGRPD